MNEPLPVRHPGRTAWRALIYFNLYRFLAAFLFVSLYWVGQLPHPLGVLDEDLFSITSHIYLFLSISAYFFIHIQNPPYAYQVAYQVAIDIICITLMIYASGGLNSGFGILLVITVAGGALLSPKRIGILYAAIATMAVLGHELFIHINSEDSIPNYIHAGFLGLTFFGAAVISQVLAIRVQESEALAQRHAFDLEKLAQLNEQIVQRLQSGIIVLDGEMTIRLLNQAAKNLLGFEKDIKDMKIDDALPVVAELGHKWKTGTGEQSVLYKSAASGIEILMSFVPLQNQQNFDVLIFMDDISIFRQRAQQIKLVSLGRLTASIAHEIRNPLGAISHASQLLKESASISMEDKRLTTIIEEHSKRVNQIIENIIGISRREKPTPVTLDLGEWLGNFKKEFELSYKLEANTVRIDEQEQEVSVRMDSLQLHQVLSNLAENAIRYSKEQPKIRIHYATNRETERPYIDVIDTGPGIGLEDEANLFEPFYTTHTQGTGLGLYIARELCEANQATLSLHGNTENGCCFRIVFSHPDKQHRHM